MNELIRCSKQSNIYNNISKHNRSIECIDFRVLNEQFLGERGMTSLGTSKLKDRQVQTD